MDSNSTVSNNKNMPIVMLSCGLSIGTALGISLGVAFNNIPIGISFGAGIGLTLGVALHKIYSSRASSCSKNK